MKKILRSLLKPVAKYIEDDSVYSDFEKIHNDIWNEVKDYTMTSKERIYGVIEAAKYISANNIEGDVVECGVWKGGTMAAVAKTLISKSNTQRKLFLYDTYEGMTEPTEYDVDFKDSSAKQQFDSNKKTDGNGWCYGALELVQQVMNGTNYPGNNIQYIKGKVEDTIPAAIPEKIALLRLDTDWYESTKHELIHLFPRLQKGGVLIIDDYGFWKGARKAVDEYLKDNDIQILLCRMDNTGRIALKQ